MNQIETNIKQNLCSDFYCDSCDYITSKKSSFDNHNMSAKHAKMATNKQELCFNYYCAKCDYGTSRKSNMDSHNTSTKHRISANETNEIIIKQKKSIKQELCPNYACAYCNKMHLNKTALWRHNKFCIKLIEKDKEPTEKDKEPTEKDKEPTEKELIMMLIKENTDFKNIIIEQSKENKELKQIVIDACKNMTSVQNIQTQNNKTFNLNFYLNETCKNAMNIMDFVDSVKLQLHDLINVGEKGFVNGISHIIVKNLNALETTKRPIQCADAKREILYIKDSDKWEKDDEDKSKMRKVIKKVADKNIRLIQNFKVEHPDCNRSTSKYSDQYNNIIVESMGGSGDNDDEKAIKIIKNIAKEIVIDKTIF